MLPEKLSNGLCSLNPDVDRLAMVCDMASSPRGEIGRYEFYPAVIRSHARLTYTEVATRSRETAPAIDEAPRRSLGRSSRRSTSCSARCSTARERRGAIDFETVETALEFDAQRQDRAHRAGAAQRRAPPDRGVHAGRERLRLRLPAEPRAPGALPRARGPDAGEARGAARVPDELRPAAGRRRRAAREGLREAARAGQEAARRRSCCRPCCCARSSRRCTARTTSATSASPTSPTRISRRRSGATRTCWCTARSRRCSPAARYAPGNWEELGMHCSMTERRADEATRDVADLAQVLLHARPRRRGVRRQHQRRSPASASS